MTSHVIKTVLFKLHNCTVDCCKKGSTCSGLATEYYIDKLHNLFSSSLRYNVICDKNCTVELVNCAVYCCNKRVHLQQNNYVDKLHNLLLHPKTAQFN